MPSFGEASWVTCGRTQRCGTSELQPIDVMPSVGEASWVTCGRTSDVNTQLATRIDVMPSVGVASWVTLTPVCVCRCRIPECEGTTGDASFSTPWLTHAVPLNKDHEPENCLRYRPLSNNTVGLNTSCPADLFNLNVTQECQEWVFAESARSIAHDFNIMCPKDFWKLTILGSFSVMTSFVGLPLVGLISDRLGRKTVMVYGAVLICCVGIIRSFAVNYEMLASLEILNGLVTGLETLSPSKRLLGSMLVNVYFAMGEVVMGCYMWIVQDWRILLRFFYIPMLAVAALHWYRF
ncbi:hypothetical protein J6590_070998 [Homalodisca vitripennis]|nr:hypothetical protein J6590_070998 [Homalodisca vitripennis]